MNKAAGIILSSIFLLTGSVAAEPKAVQSSSPAGDYVSSEGELLIKKLKDQAKEKATAKKKKEEPAYLELSKADAEIEGRNKVLQGKVSGIGPTGIAIEYEADEKAGASSEKWFPFVKGVNFNGFKKYTELQIGDSVSAVYKESVDGKKRFLKGVTLVAKKPKEPEQPAAVAEPVEEEQAPEGGSAS